MKVCIGIIIVLLITNGILFNKVTSLISENAELDSMLNTQNKAIKELEVNKKELDNELLNLNSKITKAYSSLSKERKTCEQRIKRLEESFKIFESLFKEI